MKPKKQIKPKKPIELKQFLIALEHQCLQENYNTITNPASVANIISSGSNQANAILVNYFLQQHKEKDLSKIKLQEYVTFIRSNRNSLFPNNYRIKPRKFISSYPYVRSSTMEYFIKQKSIIVNKD